MSTVNLAKRIARLERLEHRRKNTMGVARGIPPELDAFRSPVYAAQATEEEWAKWDEWKRKIGYPWPDKVRKNSPEDRARSELWMQIFRAEYPRYNPDWEDDFNL